MRNKNLFFVPLFCVCFLFSCDTKTGGNNFNAPPLDKSIVQKYIYPNTNVTIDTIAEQTNLTEFVYNNDTIVFENLFLPLFSEYDEEDGGDYKKIVDTTKLRYGNKQWLLPQNWQDEKLSLDYVLHIKTKNRRYLGFVLTDITANPIITRNKKIAVVDIDSGDAVCRVDDFSAPLTSFLDYDGDGILEYTFMSERILGKEGNPSYEKYTLVLCHLTPDGIPEITSGNDEKLILSHLDSMANIEMIEELIKSSQE